MPKERAPYYKRKRVIHPGKERIKGYKARWETEIIDGAELPWHKRAALKVINAGMAITRRRFKGTVWETEPYTKESILEKRKKIRGE